MHEETIDTITYDGKNLKIWTDEENMYNFKNELVHINKEKVYKVTVEIGENPYPNHTEYYNTVYSISVFKYEHSCGYQVAIMWDKKLVDNFIDKNYEYEKLKFVEENKENTNLR